MYIRCRVLVLLVFTTGLACAEVKPAAIFSSGMVLQHSQKNLMWGWADPGERVTITIGGTVVQTKTGKAGRWSIVLPSFPPGGPYTIKIQAKNAIQFTDVLFGDVWLCSGQSNMEFRLMDAMNGAAAVRNADFQRIRMFSVNKRLSHVPTEDMIDGEWKICTPEHAASFSAVAYFFGRELSERMNIPIGLIQSTWGGTVAESWISLQTMKQFSDFKERSIELESFGNGTELQQRQNDTKRKLGVDELPLEDEGFWNGKARYAAIDFDDSGWSPIAGMQSWENEGYNNIDGIGWYRKVVMLDSMQAVTIDKVTLGSMDDNDITWINGVRVGATNRDNVIRTYKIDRGILVEGRNVIAVRVEDTGGGGGMFGPERARFFEAKQTSYPIDGAWRFKISEVRSLLNSGPNDYPALLFNGMINPLIPYGIKGVIWYQGESNTQRAKQYKKIFPALIGDWRNHWAKADLPFIYVMLANHKTADRQPVDAAWAELREAQIQTLTIPHTAMASAIDLGDAEDIHPKNKQDVARRLVLAALNLAYNKDVVFSGPMVDSVTFGSSKIVVRFKNVGAGLMAKNKYGYVNCFAVAGSDQKFYWATAKIISPDAVEVFAKDVKDPVAVRFAWSNNPDDFNLYNKEGLPAVPFRTDTWPGITK